MASTQGRTVRKVPTLFIIGGAEDRVGKATVLRRFVRLAGGRSARIVVIPTASSFQDEVVAAYTEVFTRLGARERGAVIGGTSAGASIMSQFMISMGDEGITPRQRHSQLSAGLGLLEGVIIDQHFGQRARYGRLMSMVAASPNLIGIGIDEDTAIEVHDRSTFVVHGRGAVFVLDCRSATSDA